MIGAPIDRLTFQFDRLVAWVGFNTAMLLAVFGLVMERGIDQLSPPPEEAAHAAVSKDAPARSGASFETKPAASPQDEGWSFRPSSGVFARIG